MKKAIAALSLCSALSLSSCLGPNHCYNNLANWNAELSDMHWLNEVVFIGFNIIPVYGVFLWGDYLIFNTIDYWSGSDSWPASPGAFPESFSNK
jgi:hypothetical protein